MKRILLSLITIAAVALTVQRTVAYFSDTETSNNNYFAAGTLNLTVDGNDGVNTVEITVSNQAPGDSGTGVWTLNNTGSINGYIDLHSLVLTDNDNGCNEPEGLVDVTCNNPGAGEGELSANLNVNLFVDVNGDGIFDPGDTTIYSGMLSGIAANYDYNLALNAGATKYISLAWDIPALTDN